MDERTDLTSGLDARVDERTHQLRSGDVRERNAPAIDSLERLRGRRRETGGVAVEFDGSNLLRSPALSRPFRGYLHFAVAAGSSLKFLGLRL